MHDKVALVLRNFNIGGTETQLIKICQQLERFGKSITLFSVSQGSDRSLLSQIPKNIEYYSSPYSHRSPLTIHWLARCISEKQFTVVHSFTWVADFICALLKKWNPNIKLICSERGDRVFGMYYSNTRYLLDRLITFPQANFFCTNSYYSKRTLINLGYRPDRIKVIPNGIDLKKSDSYQPFDIRHHFNWPEDAVIIGCVSRLEWFKGVNTLVLGIAKLTAHYPVYCVILGDGEERSQLETLVQDLGIVDRIKFVGPIFPVEPWVKGFDIAVLLSNHSESCSNSILEYMSCAKPIIATSIGGNLELVLNHQTGILVPPNSPESFSESLREMISNWTQTQCMGTQGRIFAEKNYDIQNMAKQLLDLWDSKSFYS